MSGGGAGNCTPRTLSDKMNSALSHPHRICIKANIMFPYKKNRGFYPKKPVRTFRDLEVYQKTLEASVIVAKDIKPKLVKLKYELAGNLTDCSMSIPLYIGEAHSIRFGDHKQGLLLLERAMAGCNKMIVYLEQVKGIYRPGPEVARPSGSKSHKNFLTYDDADLIDDLIGRYADVRTKIFRLEKSWQKWDAPRK